MDPARPADPDPADPFFGERGDDAVLETIEIATEGEDCDECVRKLRPMLKWIPDGVERTARPTTAIAWNSRRIPNTIHGKNCATRRIDFPSYSRLLLCQAMKSAQSPDQFATIDPDDTPIRKTIPQNR